MSPTKPANGGVKLVVVESPTKARTIAGYLGDGYIVESSVGHIRDLPRGAADVPAKYKGESWARLGVDVDHGFEPLYIVPADKKAQVAKLKSLLAGADELYLATDEDREGEAIAWHLLETLKPKVPVKRMVFHEITPAAIREAATPSARARRQPGRRPGDPTHPRPALRLRGLAGAVEEGHAEAVGRPGAVGGHPDRRRARARADGVPVRHLLGHRRPVPSGGRWSTVRRGAGHRSADASWRPARTTSTPATGRLLDPDTACCCSTRTARAGGGRLTGRPDRRGVLGGGEALHPQAVCRRS